MSRVDISEYLPSLPLLDSFQPLFEQFAPTMVESIGVDVQRCDLERCLKRAWDSRKDYIPEQQPENGVYDPPFRMQPVWYVMNDALP